MPVDASGNLHHLDFTELMGNVAFNNTYGKETACKLAWTFLTEVMGIPKESVMQNVYDVQNKFSIYDTDIFRPIVE
ncbi:hypothetical protein PENTCL1PPCAC_8260, partial [Pristionchus entomophagus]